MEQKEPTDELWRSLRAYVMRRGADLHTAEDIVQETWLRAVRRPPEDRGRLRGWLQVVARRYLNQVRRSQRIQTEDSGSVARDDSALSSVEAMGPASVVRFVDELPDLYREVVRLRFLEDRSVGEIAALTGRTEATVRSQLKRGLDRLRARLGAHPERRHAWLGFGWLAALLRRKERRKGLTASFAVAVCVGVALFALDRRGDLRSEELRVASAPFETPRASTELTAAEPALAGRTGVATESVAPPAAPVTGVVRTPEGDPAPGATVHALTADESSPAIETETDASGRYTLAAGRNDVVWATHPDSLPSNRCYVASSDIASDLDLFLRRPWASADYVVRTADGDPVVGAEIVAQRDIVPEVASIRETMQFLVCDPGVFTDSEGRARVHFSEARTVQMSVEIGGEIVWSRQVTPQEAARSTVVTLPRRGTVLGTVVDPSGAPARNALVELAYRAARGRPRHVRTDTDGTFRVEDQVPGPFILRVLEDPSVGMASARHEGAWVAGDRVDLGEIALSDQTSIHGRVFRDAQPVAGARVTLRSENQSGDSKLRRTTTDRNGLYVFGGCPRWAIYTVFTTPPSGAFQGDSVPAHPGPTPIDLALELGGPTAPVVLEFTGSSAPRLVEIRREPCASLVLEPALGTRAFRSGPLPAGSYEVLAWLPGLGTWRAGTIVHDPRSSAVHDFETPQGAQISVRLDFPRGYPRTASVALLTPGFNSYGSESFGAAGAYMDLPWDDSQGAFTAIVAPQAYYLATSAAGLANTMTRIAIEDGLDNRVDVPLEPGTPARLVFRSPRALILGEIVGLEYQTPHGTTHFAMHWTDQTEEEFGFAFDVSLPRATTEIRVLSTLRPDATVPPLRGVRHVTQEQLEGAPPKLEIDVE